jgi:glyoxylase-like metal-dependent hydrolase (beta-lactamase superfamily II)
MASLQFGSITVQALEDGTLAFPLAQMLPEADAGSFSRFGGVTSDGLLQSPMTTYAIRAEGKLILVDTGIGGDIAPLARFGYTGTAGRLPAALAAAGIARETVDDVVLTHLHSDHIGWNTVPDGDVHRPMFPNARYIATRADWENRATVAGRSNAARCLDPVKAAGQLTLAADGFEVAPGVSLFATPGHTPGHTSILVVDGGEGAIITGDAAHHPAEVENPDMSPPFDFDPAQSAVSRQALVERAEAEGLVILGGHFPAPGAGTIVRVGQRRQWRWLGA